MSARGDPSFMRSKALAATLLVIGILGFVSAAWGLSVMGDSDLFDFSTFEGKGSVEGHVILESGAGIENVTIRIIGTDISTESGVNGTYEIEKAPAGRQTIVYEGDGKNVTLTTFISPSTTNKFDVTIYEDPSKNQVTDLDDMETISRGVVVVLGSIITAISTFVLIGAYLALRRKRYMTVVSASIMGLFSFGFCIGSVLSFLAIVLVIYAKRDFVVTGSRTTGSDDMTKGKDGIVKETKKRSAGKVKGLG